MARKALALSDSIISSHPVQAVTWRNWQQYVDREHLKSAIQVYLENELNAFDNSIALNLGRRWLDSIPRIDELFNEFIPDATIAYVISAETGANYDSVSAGELIEDWSEWNQTQRILYLLKAWNAVNHCEPAFRRVGDSYISIAGVVAICFVLEVPTS